MHFNTFRKPEHLCHDKAIKELFSAGSKSFTIYPIRATFRTMVYSGNGPRVKVLLSVSKRRLKHAVDRNRAKRQLREAYRLQKTILNNALPENTAVNIAFIWLAEAPILTYKVMERMQTILTRCGEYIQREQPANTEICNSECSDNTQT